MASISECVVLSGKVNNELIRKNVEGRGHDIFLAFDWSD
jgi:hypothetical protein